MTVHQCPKCELRFSHKTELDDHCWHDHPQFQHDYPAVVRPPEPAAAEQAPPATAEHQKARLSDSLMRWVVPKRHHD